MDLKWLHIQKRFAWQKESNIFRLYARKQNALTKEAIMIKREIIAELERIYSNATFVESFFYTIILVSFLSIMIAGLFILIHTIWTGITLLVELGIDVFWEWKNTDIENYSQRRYDAFKKKQFERWKKENKK